MRIPTVARISSILRRLLSPSWWISSSHLIKPEGSSRHSQQFAAEKCTDPQDQWSPPFTVYLKIHFNITSPPRSVCSKRSNRFWFSGYDAVCIFQRPHTCYIPFPIILKSFGEERNLGIPALQWNNREAKVKFVPLCSPRTSKTFCVQEGGRTVPRITVGLGGIVRSFTHRSLYPRTASLGTVKRRQFWIIQATASVMNQTKLDVVTHETFPQRSTL